MLVGLEQEGQLYITSFRPGASLPEKIAGGLLPSSRQEFQHEMLETSSGTFSGVMVWPTMAQPEPQTEMPVESDGNRKKSSTLLQETKAAFQQEVVRFALSPDGFATHTQLIEHMFA